MTLGAQKDLDRRLFEGIKARSLAACIKAIDDGSDPNADADDVDRTGNTALTKALGSSTQAIIALLIDGGAQVTAKSERHCSPLVVAAQWCGSTACRLLLDRGAEVNKATLRDDRTALQVAAADGNAGLCQLFIDAGADVGAVDLRGFSALHLAVWSREEGALDTCKVLVAAGASIDLVAPFRPMILNPTLLSPFQAAIVDSRLDMVRYFVEECGASLTQRTLEGMRMVELAFAEPVRTYLCSAMAATSVAHSIDASTSAGREGGTRTRSFSPL
jgi:ankyrin repeat protein